jgi:nucleoside-diphosphate-sugar epimerase
MLAAAGNRPYRITFTGRAVFQYADDVARRFVAASRVPTTTAQHLNIGGASASVPDVVAAIETVLPESKGLITVDGPEIPNATRVDDAGLRGLIGDIGSVSLEEGVERTVFAFKDLLERGLVTPPS